MFVFFNCQQLLPSLTKLINLSSFLCVPKIKSLINMIKLFIYLYVLKLVYTFTTFSTTIFLPTTNYQLLLISYFLFLTSYFLPLTPCSFFKTIAYRTTSCNTHQGQSVLHVCHVQQFFLRGEHKFRRHV